MYQPDRFISTTTGDRTGFDQLVINEGNSTDINNSNIILLTSPMVNIHNTGNNMNQHRNNNHNPNLSFAQQSSSSPNFNQSTTSNPAISSGSISPFLGPASSSSSSAIAGRSPSLRPTIMLGDGYTSTNQNPEYQRSLRSACFMAANSEGGNVLEHHHHQQQQNNSHKINFNGDHNDYNDSHSNNHGTISPSTVTLAIPNNNNYYYTSTTTSPSKYQSGQTQLSSLITQEQTMRNSSNANNYNSLAKRIAMAAGVSGTNSPFIGRSSTASSSANNSPNKNCITSSSLFLNHQHHQQGDETPPSGFQLSASSYQQYQPANNNIGATLFTRSPKLTHSSSSQNQQQPQQRPPTLPLVRSIAEAAATAAASRSTSNQRPFANNSSLTLSNSPPPSTGLFSLPSHRRNSSNATTMNKININHNNYQNHNNNNNNQSRGSTSSTMTPTTPNQNQAQFPFQGRPSFSILSGSSSFSGSQQQHQLFAHINMNNTSTNNNQQFSAAQYNNNNNNNANQNNISNQIRRTHSSSSLSSSAVTPRLPVMSASSVQSQQQQQQLECDQTANTRARKPSFVASTPPVQTFSSPNYYNHQQQQNNTSNVNGQTQNRASMSPGMKTPQQQTTVQNMLHSNVATPTTNYFLNNNNGNVNHGLLSGANSHMNSASKFLNNNNINDNSLVLFPSSFLSGQRTHPAALFSPPTTTATNARQYHQDMNNNNININITQDGSGILEGSGGSAACVLQTTCVYFDDDDDLNEENNNQYQEEIGNQHHQQGDFFSNFHNQYHRRQQQQQSYHDGTPFRPPPPCSQKNSANGIRDGFIDLNDDEEGMNEEEYHQNGNQILHHRHNNDINFYPQHFETATNTEMCEGGGEEIDTFNPALVLDDQENGPQRVTGFTIQTAIRDDDADSNNNADASLASTGVIVSPSAASSIHKRAMAFNKGGHALFSESKPHKQLDASNLPDTADTSPIALGPTTHTGESSLIISLTKQVYLWTPIPPSVFYETDNKNIMKKTNSAKHGGVARNKRTQHHQNKNNKKRSKNQENRSGESTKRHHEDDDNIAHDDDEQEKNKSSPSKAKKIDVSPFPGKRYFSADVEEEEDDDQQNQGRAFETNNDDDDDEASVSSSSSSSNEPKTKNRRIDDDELSDFSETTENSKNDEEDEAFQRDDCKRENHRQDEEEPEEGEEQSSSSHNHRQQPQHPSAIIEPLYEGRFSDQVSAVAATTDNLTMLLAGADNEEEHIEVDTIYCTGDGNKKKNQSAMGNCAARNKKRELIVALGKTDGSIVLLRLRRRTDEDEEKEKQQLLLQLQQQQKHDIKNTSNNNSNNNHSGIVPLPPAVVNNSSNFPSPSSSNHMSGATPPRRNFVDPTNNNNNFNNSLPGSMTFQSFPSLVFPDRGTMPQLPSIQNIQRNNNNDNNTTTTNMFTSQDFADREVEETTMIMMRGQQSQDQHPSFERADENGDDEKVNDGDFQYGENEEEDDTLFNNQASRNLFDNINDDDDLHSHNAVNNHNNNNIINNTAAILHSQKIDDDDIDLEIDLGTEEEEDNDEENIEPIEDFNLDVDENLFQREEFLGVANAVSSATSTGFDLTVPPISHQSNNGHNSSRHLHQQLMSNGSSQANSYSRNGEEESTVLTSEVNEIRNNNDNINGSPMSATFQSLGSTRNGVDVNQNQRSEQETNNSDRKNKNQLREDENDEVKIPSRLWKEISRKVLHVHRVSSRIVSLQFIDNLLFSAADDGLVFCTIIDREELFVTAPVLPVVSASSSTPLQQNSISKYSSGHNNNNNHGNNNLLHSLPQQKSQDQYFQPTSLATAATGTAASNAGLFILSSKSSKSSSPSASPLEMPAPIFNSSSPTANATSTTTATSMRIGRKASFGLNINNEVDDDHGSAKKNGSPHRLTPVDSFRQNNNNNNHNNCKSCPIHSSSQSPHHQQISGYLPTNHSSLSPTANNSFGYNSTNFVAPNSNNKQHPHQQRRAAASSSSSPANAISCVTTKATTKFHFDVNADVVSMIVSPDGTHIALGLREGGIIVVPVANLARRIHLEADMTFFATAMTWIVPPPSSSPSSSSLGNNNLGGNYSLGLSGTHGSAGSASSSPGRGGAIGAGVPSTIPSPSTSLARAANNNDLESLISFGNSLILMSSSSVHGGVHNNTANSAPTPTMSNNNHSISNPFSVSPSTAAAVANRHSHGSSSSPQSSTFASHPASMRFLFNNNHYTNSDINQTGTIPTTMLTQSSSFHVVGNNFASSSNLHQHYHNHHQSHNSAGHLLLAHAGGERGDDLVVTSFGSHSGEEIMRAPLSHQLVRIQHLTGVTTHTLVLIPNYETTRPELRNDVLLNDNHNNGNDENTNEEEEDDDIDDNNGNENRQTVVVVTNRRENNLDQRDARQQNRPADVSLLQHRFNKKAQALGVFPLHQMCIVELANNFTVVKRKREMYRDQYDLHGAGQSPSLHVIHNPFNGMFVTGNGGEEGFIRLWQIGSSGAVAAQSMRKKIMGSRSDFETFATPVGILAQQQNREKEEFVSSSSGCCCCTIHHHGEENHAELMNEAQFIAAAPSAKVPTNSWSPTSFSGGRFAQSIGTNGNNNNNGTSHNVAGVHFEQNFHQPPVTVARRRALVPNESAAAVAVVSTLMEEEETSRHKLFGDEEDQIR